MPSRSWAHPVSRPWDLATVAANGNAEMGTDPGSIALAGDHGAPDSTAVTAATSTSMSDRRPRIRFAGQLDDNCGLVNVASVGTEVRGCGRARMTRLRCDHPLRFCPPGHAAVGSVGARGRCWGSSQAGGVNSGRPLVMVTVQPPWWITSWCLPHSRTRLVRAVGPPSAQCRMWWASVHLGGRRQPGNAQDLSRATSARRSAGGISRVAGRCPGVRSRRRAPAG